MFLSQKWSLFISPKLYIYHFGDINKPNFWVKNTYIYALDRVSGRVFANGPGDWGPIPAQVIPKTQKMILDTSRVKWTNPGKGVVPFPTSRCSSYWKGSLWVTLDYGCQLSFLYIGMLNVIGITENGIGDPS